MIDNFKLLIIQFWPIIAAAVLLLGGFIGLKMKQKFKFKKYIQETDNGLKATVYLHYNRFAGSDLENVTLRDFVPETVEVENPEPEELELSETENGTSIILSEETLEPGEKLEFSYMMKPDFDVETEVELSSAELEHEGKKLKETNKVKAKFSGEAT